ncbi:hypothetical protein DRO29_06160, partial [Candidatus Bathyarchaeota archaeon]
MKLVIISSSQLKTPPDNYGGLELICYYLARELAKKSHEIYLVATKGSKADGYELIETIEPQTGVFEDWRARDERAYKIWRPKVEEILDDETVLIDHSWYKY